MPTLFTRIIDGEIPARFVWRDPLCVVFLTIAPIAPGHVLVVPRAEIDHWIDADDALMSHLTSVARMMGTVLQSEYRPARIGLLVAGFEIPHLHIHVIPMNSMADIDFANADPDVGDDALAATAARIRAALAAAGYEPAS